MTDNDKNDLTRIEDLKEYLHEEDDSKLSDLLEKGPHPEENPNPPDFSTFEESLTFLGVKPSISKTVELIGVISSLKNPF